MSLPDDAQQRDEEFQTNQILMRDTELYQAIRAAGQLAPGGTVPRLSAKGRVVVDFELSPAEMANGRRYPVTVIGEMIEYHVHELLERLVAQGRLVDISTTKVKPQ